MRITSPSPLLSSSLQPPRDAANVSPRVRARATRIISELRDRGRDHVDILAPDLEFSRGELKALTGLLRATFGNRLSVRTSTVNGASGAVYSNLRYGLRA